MKLPKIPKADTPFVIELHEMITVVLVFTAVVVGCISIAAIESNRAYLATTTAEKSAEKLKETCPPPKHPDERVIMWRDQAKNKVRCQRLIPTSAVVPKAKF